MNESQIDQIERESIPQHEQSISGVDGAQCPECAGSGVVPNMCDDTHFEKCPRCTVDTRKTAPVLKSGPKTGEKQAESSTCAKPCSECGGSGWVPNFCDDTHFEKCTRCGKKAAAWPVKQVPKPDSIEDEVAKMINFAKGKISRAVSDYTYPVVTIDTSLDTIATEFCAILRRERERAEKVAGMLLRERARHNGAIDRLKADIAELVDIVFGHACADMLDRDGKTLVTNALSSEVEVLEILERFGKVRILPGGVGRAQRAEIISKSEDSES